MCGRFSSSKPTTLVARAFEAADETGDEHVSYNVAPTAMIQTVVERPNGERSLAMRKWGLIPSWSKDPSIGNKLFNARLETLTEKASFRDALRTRRCLIPIDGYYEWQATADGKQPWFITGLNGKGLVLAGLYETWNDIDSATIITTAAKQHTSHIHDRQPLFVPKEYWSDWLAPDLQNPAELVHTLDALDVPVDSYKVGAGVGNTRNDSPDLKEPVTL